MFLSNLASISGVNLFRSLIQFTLNLVLAIYITPSEYGLVVFTIPFLAFLSMLTDMGLSSAMVRSKTLSPDTVGAVLSLSFTVGTIFALALGGSSPLVERLARLPGLSPVMSAFSFVLLLTVIAAPLRAVLERALAFKTIALAEGVSTLASAVLGVTVAAMGGRVWALVASNLVMQLLRLGFFWFAARKDVRLNFNWGAVSGIVQFGGWVMGANIVAFMARNIGNVIIGASLGASSVGLYGLANQIMIAPLMIITWPASGVLMATASRRLASGDSAIKLIAAVLSVTALVTFPGMAFLTQGFATPVHLFLSHHWAEVVPLVSWLAPLGAIQSVAGFNGVIMLAYGHSRTQFISGLVNSALTVLVFFLAAPMGLMFMIKAYVLSNAVTSLALLSWSMVLVKFPLVRFARDLAPAILAALGATLVLWLVLRLGSSFGVWALGVFAYGLAVLGIYVCFRRQILDNLTEFKR